MYAARPVTRFNSFFLMAEAWPGSYALAAGGFDSAVLMLQGGSPLQDTLRGTGGQSGRLGE